MPPGFRRGAVELSIAAALLCAGCSTYRAETHTKTSVAHPVKVMADGRQWTASNLVLPLEESSCYDNAESNCRRYGRLYTWKAAQRACRSLGGRWRVPADDEWRGLAKRYGGIRGDSNDGGQGAYGALLKGGSSGFDAVLGGGRDPDGRYRRLEAHGFYWTATEVDSTSAVFYNFGRGGRSLNRQPEGEKEREFSVRCIR